MFYKQCITYYVVNPLMNSYKQCPNNGYTRSSKARVQLDSKT